MMFPEQLEDYLADYLVNETETERPTAAAFTGKSFLYDFQKGEFVLRDGKLVEVYGKEALKVWIEKVIRTHRFRFKIYEDTPYGVRTEDLIGSVLPQGFVQSELKRELTEAILTNEFIQSLTNWEFEHEGSRWTIRFSVETVEGAFEMEVTP